jgi:hypothetical protein
MTDKPSPPVGPFGKLMAALKRLVTEGDNAGDLPRDIHVSSPDSPGNLSAYRAPGAGTLSGLGSGDWEAEDGKKGQSPATASKPGKPEKPGIPGRNRQEQDPK